MRTEPIKLGWWLYSFSTRHINFKHPDKLGIAPPDKFGEPVIRDFALRRQLDCGTAFFCSYYEHGLCWWGLKGAQPAGVEFQWDGRRVAGLLVWQGGARTLLPKTFEERQKAAAAFLEDYTKYANGEATEDDPAWWLEEIQVRDARTPGKARKKRKQCS